MKLVPVRPKIIPLQIRKKAAAARSTGLRPIHFNNRTETAARFSASDDNHYKIVIISKQDF